MPKDNAPQYQTLSPKSAPVSKETQALLETIHKALLEKNADRIVQLDVRGLSPVTDFFIICSAPTDIQIKTYADSVTESTKKMLGESVWKKEGLSARRWVILDYVNVVVHIFKDELRDYYNLEKMWNDAIITHITE
jgi:ribosome-associated protein